MIDSFKSYSYKNGKSIILQKMNKLMYKRLIPDQSFDRGFYNETSKNVQEYIDLLQKELKKVDINVFDFINQYEDEVFSDDDFIAKNSFLDSLLYEYDKKKGVLSGMKLLDHDVDAYYFKYTYGYHNYDMGKRYILQSFDRLDDYFRKVAEKIIVAYLYAMFGFQNNKVIQPHIFIKKHQEGYIVYADLKLIHSEIVRDFRISVQDYEEFENSFRDDLQDDIILKDGVLAFFVNLSKKSLDDKEFKEAQENFELQRSVNKYNL